MASTKKKIILVEDHPLMRKGMAMTLNNELDLEVCCEASSAEEALDYISGCEDGIPDIAIVDISLPGMTGLELIKQIKHYYPELDILVVSRHDESLYAERAIRAGAKGYVMKLEASETIVKAVRRVLNKGIFISEEVNSRLLMGMAGEQNRQGSSPLEVLSDRELEVFELTGKGFNTRTISEKLHLSVKTVETYRSRIKEKLNLQSSTELLQRAVEWVGSEEFNNSRK